jgi:drug/metabolite transporter (DMT)-like permease
MESVRSRGPLLAVALATTIVVAVGVHELLVSDLALAVTAGICWGGGLALTLRHLTEPPMDGSGGWSVARWSGAFGGSLTLAATVGVSPGLPLAPDARFALSVLVLGFGVLAFNLGGAMVLEARDETAGSE